MEPPPGDRWVKKHPNGCISYKDDEGKMQMWRPEFDLKGQDKEKKGYIYILANATFLYLDTYNIGFALKPENEVRMAHNTALVNVKMIAFVPGSANDADRLFDALTGYKISRGVRKTTVIIPLRVLMEIVQKVLGNVQFKEVRLSKSDVRKNVDGEELKRHITVFLKLYQRHEDRFIDRDSIYIAFVEYLKPLSLFVPYTTFWPALHRLGYPTSESNAASFKEFVQRSIKQTALCSRSEEYVYIITDVESQRHDRYKIGHSTLTYEELIDRYRVILPLPPIIIATFPGTRDTETRLLGALSGYTIPHKGSSQPSEVAIIPLGNLIVAVQRVLDIDLSKTVKAGPKKELIRDEELLEIIKSFIPLSCVKPDTNIIDDVLDLYEQFIDHLRKVDPLRFVRQVHFRIAMQKLGYQFQVRNPHSVRPPRP